MSLWRRLALAYAAPLGLAAAGLAASGCSPHIGDHCAVNSDCSLQGNLQCDTSQPDGYCTLFNCTSNSCQNNAVCVAVNASVPGCLYDDYQSPSRTSLNMCLQSCTKNSDCRTSEGYVCADPTQPPWNAKVLDTDFQRACLAMPTYDVDAAALSDAAVCSPGIPPLDASSADGSVDAAAADTGLGDGAVEAGDGGLPEGGVDAANDGAVDAGGTHAADASDGD